MFFSQPQRSSKFGPEAPIFSDWAPGALILHLPKNLLILCAIEQVVLAEFRGVIEVAARSHLFVDVLGFDIEEERVCIRVQQLAATALLRLHHVLLQGIPKVLGPVQHGIVHVLKSVERQPSLGDLHGRQLVIKHVCGAYQFNVHQLVEVFHGLSKDADVHELEQVFLEVPDGFLPQLSRARSRGSAQSRGPVDFL